MNGVICRFVSNLEIHPILKICHSSLVGGHHNEIILVANVIQSGFYWPTLIETPMTWLYYILHAKYKRYIYESWNSIETKSMRSYVHKYIMVAIDCVSKWIEVVWFPTLRAGVSQTFWKNKFSHSLASLSYY